MTRELTAPEAFGEGVSSSLAGGEGRCWGRKKPFLLCFHLTLSSSEGALPWWEEGWLSRTACPGPTAPAMTRAYGSRGIGVRWDEEGPLQEKGLVHLHRG